MTATPTVGDVVRYVHSVAVDKSDVESGRSG
jgi:hypothetical protein